MFLIQLLVVPTKKKHVLYKVILRSFVMIDGLDGLVSLLTKLVVTDGGLGAAKAYKYMISFL